LLSIANSSFIATSLNTLHNTLSDTINLLKNLHFLFVTASNSVWQLNTTFIRILSPTTLIFYYFLFILFYYFQIFKLHIVFYYALLLSCNLHTANTSVA